MMGIFSCFEGVVASEHGRQVFRDQEFDGGFPEVGSFVEPRVKCDNNIGPGVMAFLRVVMI